MLVVFDWDGTLMDSTAKIVRSMQEAAANLNLPVRADKPIEQIIGLSLPVAIDLLYPNLLGGQKKSMCQEYAKVFVVNEKKQPCQLFAGVAECLDTLHCQGYKLAIATGKSRRGLDRVLESVSQRSLFTASRCADETASKPDPLMLNELMRECDVESAQCIMIGDTEFDLEMAVNANMRRVGVSYGAHSVDQLQKHRPIAILDSLIELPDLLMSA